jgi:hypothetical protein
MPGPDTTLDSDGPSSRVLLVAGVVVVVLLGGTVALWAHTGTTLFFEMIRAGFMACFG